MTRSLRNPLLYPFMTYKTNPMLWYAMKKGWIDRVFANVGLQWCQGRSISPRCQHLVGEDVWEKLCKKKESCVMLHPMVPYKQWGEGTIQGEAAPKNQASLDSCNEWREMLHRWSSEERMTCREGCKTATGERLGQGWVKTLLSQRWSSFKYTVI